MSAQDLACGCRWPLVGDEPLRLCGEHQLHRHLEKLEPESRDFHLRRFLDLELDQFVRDYARGRRLEPRQALGPATRRP